MDPPPGIPGVSKDAPGSTKLNCNNFSTCFIVGLDQRQHSWSRWYAVPKKKQLGS